MQVSRREPQVTAWVLGLIERARGVKGDTRVSSTTRRASRGGCSRCAGGSPTLLGCVRLWKRTGLGPSPFRMEGEAWVRPPSVRAQAARGARNGVMGDQSPGMRLARLAHALSGAAIPEGFSLDAHSPASTALGRAGRGRQGPCAPHAGPPEPPGGSTAARGGCGRRGASIARSAPEDQTPGSRSGRSGARPGICVLPRPGRSGRRCFQSPGSGQGPRHQPRGTRPQVRPPVRPPRRLSLRGRGGRGWARPHLCPPSFPPRARGARRRFPSRVPGGGGSRVGEAGAGRAAEAALRAHAASGARPPPSSFPGGVRRGLTKTCGGGGGDRGAGCRAAPRPSQVSGGPGCSLGRGPARGRGERSGSQGPSSVPRTRRGGRASWRMGGADRRPLDPRSRPGFSRILGGGLRGEGAPGADEGRWPAGPVCSGSAGLGSLCVRRPRWALALSPCSRRQLPSLGAPRGSLAPGKPSPDLRPLLPFAFQRGPAGERPQLQIPHTWASGPPARAGALQGGLAGVTCPSFPENGPGLASLGICLQKEGRISPLSIHIGPSGGQTQVWLSHLTTGFAEGEVPHAGVSFQGLSLRVWHLSPLLRFLEKNFSLFL